MNILILNITKKWIYNLYEEYILSFKEFINKYYDEKNINIDMFFFEEHNFSITTLNSINFSNYDKLILSGNIKIIQNISYIHKSIYFVNIEQMSKESYYVLLRELPSNIKIIDYSEENIPYLKDFYKTYLFTPYYKFQKDITINDKNIDILSITNNDYRRNIFDTIESKTEQNNYNVVSIDDCYGDERNEYFNKTKIYLNIHCSKEHRTMELIRIINLIMRKVIVVSQSSVFPELLFLKKYIFVCSDDKYLHEFINEIMKNYENYFSILYDTNNFDENSYIEYIKQNLNLFIDS